MVRFQVEMLEGWGRGGEPGTARGGDLLLPQAERDAHQSTATSTPEIDELLANRFDPGSDGDTLVRIKRARSNKVFDFFWRKLQGFSIPLLPPPQPRLYILRFKKCQRSTLDGTTPLGGGFDPGLEAPSFEGGAFVLRPP